MSLVKTAVLIVALVSFVVAQQSCSCPTAKPTPPPPTSKPSGSLKPNEQQTGRNGKTVFMIGQNELNEFKDYVNAINVAPGGSSFYSNIYANSLGDQMEGYLAYMNTHYPGSFVEFGLDVKGNFFIFYGDYDVTKDTAQQWKDILQGTRFNTDANLQMLINTFKKYTNVTILMRIDYEVSGNLHANTDRYNWVYTTQDPSYYKAAFCKIANMFRAQVPHVKTVYHPVRGQHLFLYPGDSCTDYIGFSIFNHDVVLPISNGVETFWNNQSGIIDSNLKAGFDWAYALGKKVIIAESSAQRPYANNPALILDYFSRVMNIINTYKVDNWVYINSNWLALGWPAEWDDSRVESKSPAFQQWWRTQVVSNPQFIHYPQ